MRELVQLNSYSAVAAQARAYFRAGHTRSIDARKQALTKLDATMRKHEAALFEALKADLGKPILEAYPSELGLVYADIRHTLKSLKSWMKPTRHLMPLTFQPARAYRYAEPLGTALILAPWNYPFQLAVSPLVGAIAAGCSVVLKPSELSPHTSAVIERILKEAFGENEWVTVVQGGADVSAALLEEKWDTIFFTGSTRVGKLVMQAAAKHLTPVTLELGGKSPAIVAADADLTVSAKRIIWGKFYNCGQTCIAPDYVLVESSAKAKLLEEMKKALVTFYGSDAKQSPDYGRICNAHHFKRLESLLTGTTVAGGQRDLSARYFEPTILTDVSPNAAVMQEEIFGPILPVLEVDNVNSAVDFVNARAKPLALYVFSSNAKTSESVLQRTSSGGALVNDTIIHIANQALPFGGVGDSGMGAYHGHASFVAFSHFKAVVKKPFWFDLAVRYPPYKVPLAAIRKLI
jgi:aldehyde dehydrogenase (NAD+)